MESGATAAKPAWGLPRHASRRDVQGLRALGVGTVVLYHAGGIIPGGFLGVDIFFVISGFVITAMLMREWGATGRINLPTFYLRRIKRLTPALAVMLLLTLVASALVLSPFGVQQMAAKTALGAVAVVANFVIAFTTGGYFDPSADLNPLLHTWSLSVEEQFYLVFPALLLLGWHRAKSQRRAAWLIGLLGLMSLGLALLGAAGFVVAGRSLLAGPLSPLRPLILMLGGFYSPLSRAWEFVAGALIALAGARAAFRHRAVAVVAGLAGAALVAFSLWHVNGATPWPGPRTLLPVAGTVLMIVAGSGPSSRNPVAWLLSTTPLVKLGDWSYSLYLWHWPCIVLARAIWPDAPASSQWAALFSLLPAIASYYLIEQPLRRLPADLRTVGRRVIFATLVPALLASLIVGAGARDNWWSRTVRSFGNDVGPMHLAQTSGCDNRAVLGDAARHGCVFNGSASGAPLYLLGDSNAGQFSETVLGVGQRTGRPVWISTANACPFVNVGWRDDRPGYRTSNDSCRRYMQGNLDYLSHARPGTVIIANADVYWTQPGFAVGSTTATVSTDGSARLQALATGMARTVKDLRGAGHHVVVVDSTPRWQGRHDWSPQSCRMIDILTSSCDERMTTTEAAAYQGPARAQLAKTVPAAGGRLWDTWATLCPDYTCATVRDGAVQYRDAAHLSVRMSQALAPELADVVADADAM